MIRSLEDNLRRYHAPFRRDYADERRRLMEAIAAEADAARRRTRRATGSIAGSAADHVSPWRRWIRPAPLAAAAVLAVAAAVWFTLFQSSEESLRDRVLASLERIRTMNVDMRTYQGNTPLRHTQVWFERDVGFSEHTTLGDTSYITVANNEYTWRHTAGRPMVARMKNYKHVTDPAEFRLDNFDLASALQNPARRDPKGDEVIDDTRCRMYRLRNGDETLRLWLDQDDLVRSFEHELRRGRTAEVTYGSINYDLPIETTQFEPSFPADAVVVAPEDYLKSTFPLSRAIYEHEAAGMVFAVHDLKRLDDRTGYMVTSVRLTDDDEKALDDGDPWRFFGDVIALAPNRGSMTHKSAVAASSLLARMKIGDLIVHWHLLNLKPSKTLEPDPSPFLIRVAAANELKKHVHHTGRSSDITFSAMLPVPGDEAGITLERFLTDLHAQGQQWQPIAQYFALVEVVPLADGGRTVIRWRDPNLFSVGEFIQHTIARIQRRPSK